MLTSNSVKTKLQVQESKDAKSGLPAKDLHYSGTYDAIAKILRSEGLPGLYAGLTGSLIGTATTSFAFFFWHSLLRDIHNKSRKSIGPNSTLTELSLGAGAGALTTAFTIPVAVITTRQQTVPASERKGLVGTAREIVNGEEGYAGLWRGLGAGVVLSVNPAITYGAYERLRFVLFEGRTTLRPWESFGQFSTTWPKFLT
jgi:hypothetical protein